jgi:hypothetical protein
MADTFTEVTSKSWFSRLGGSIKSVLVGLVLFLVAFPLLWWNEGRAVTTSRSLAEGKAAVVSVSADTVNPANEKKLVHLSGLATTEETLTDADFGVAAPAIKLVRTVGMYQWDEEKKTRTTQKLGGGEETTTTYVYKKVWSERALDSSGFRQPEGHQNPGALPWASKTITASRVTLGVFTLPGELVEKANATEDVRVDARTAEALPQGTFVVPSNGVYYKGADPAAPRVGDVRVQFQIVKPQVVSIVARQRGSTFEAYQAEAGDSILLLEEGTRSAEAMFKAAESANTILTWVLRAVGLFVMFLGLTMILRPISVFGSVIPLVGSLLGAGLGLFSFLTAAGLSLVTIALAWIFYRPLLGIGLLAVAGGAVVLLARFAAKKKAAAPAPAS